MGSVVQPDLSRPPRPQLRGLGRHADGRQVHAVNRRRPGLVDARDAQRQRRLRRYADRLVPAFDRGRPCRRSGDRVLRPPPAMPNDPSILSADIGKTNFCIDVSIQPYKDGGSGAAREHDTSSGSRGKVVADPFRQSLDTSPAPRGVNELRVWGDRPLEQCAPPLGVSLVPRLEVRVDDVVHTMTLRPRACSDLRRSASIPVAAHGAQPHGTAAEPQLPAFRRYGFDHLL